MAEQAEDALEDELIEDLDDGLEPEDGDDDQQEDNPEGDEPEDEFSIEIEGEEAAPASGERDSEVLRALRATNRKQAADLAALRAQSQPQAVEVGPEPTLEGCEWDEPKFKADLLAWNARQAEADKAKVTADQQVEARGAEIAESFATYNRQKAALKVQDFDDVSDVVASTLTQDQAVTVIMAADNPANVVYALGKHPAKLAAIAAITNPIKLAAAISKLEGSIKVTTKSRTAPEPEEKVRGSAPLSKATDKELERLEAKAARDPSFDRGLIRKHREKMKARANR